MYFANRRLDLGEGFAEPGEPLPQAPHWTTLQAMVSSRWVVEKPEPKNMAELYALVEEINVPRLSEEDLMRVFEGIVKRLNPEWREALIAASDRVLPSPASIDPTAAVFGEEAKETISNFLETSESPSDLGGREEVSGVGVLLHDVSPESVGLEGMVVNTTTTPAEVGLTDEEAVAMGVASEVPQEDPTPPVSFEGIVCTQCDPPRQFAHTQGLEMHMRAKHGVGV